jgi:hypothetical protein
MRKVVFLALLAVMMLPAVSAKADPAADKRAAQQIGSQLKQSGKLQCYTIGVAYHNGVASLEGTVTSEEQRDTAIRLAGHCKGVKRVVNKLQIAAPAPKAASEDRDSLAAALDRATQTSAKQEPPSGSPVMQAFDGNNGRQASTRPISVARNIPAPARTARRRNMPVPAGIMQPIRQANAIQQAGGACPGGCYGEGAPMGMGGPGMMAGGMGAGGMEAVPVGFVPHGAGRGPSYENAQMPGYAWPSYASYPNYAALSYPRQYSPTAWPYIGPFYPYPQVPLAWRKVSLEWDDGWWFLDFSAHNSSH